MIRHILCSLQRGPIVQEYLDASAPERVVTEFLRYARGLAGTFTTLSMSRLGDALAGVSVYMKCGTQLVHCQLEMIRFHVRTRARPTDGP
jgi:hypothetical protein